jgi:enoyl-CoA hydratase/carnithine racemase
MPGEQSSAPTVRYEVAAQVATVTIDRAERRNALSWTVIAEMRAALARARADADVHVVVVTGAGDKAFCAGADLGGVVDGAGFVDLHHARGAIADLFRDLWALGKPTIARVRGFALAGGFGLALSCDVVIAAIDAQFGTPEIDVGMWPMMITVPMLRSMPPKVALELMMTGRRVGVDEALRIGFVNRVVAVDELDATVAEVAGALATKSPSIMRLGRDAFYGVLDQPADDALRLLHASLTLVNQTEDSVEGIRAFQEKRTPRWTGR